MNAKRRQRVKRTLRARDGARCRLCGIAEGENVRLTIDHVIPKAMGGSNKLENLRLLCDPCDDKRHFNDMEAIGDRRDGKEYA